MKSRSKADLNGEDLVPRGKGTYALLMRLDGQSEIELGNLGRAQFPSGYYLYFGSISPWAPINSLQSFRIWSRGSSAAVWGSSIAAW